MIWWTWRQHRIQVLWTAAALAVLGVWMAVSGRALSQEYQRLGIGACLAAARDCSGSTSVFLNAHQGLAFLTPLFLVVPGIIGVFWGAPLAARELETGTHRLAWTQSVTPRRWLAAELALLGGGAVAVNALLAWLVLWWSGPLAAASQDSFFPGVFDLRGIVPIAYGLFAFVLGAAAGMVLKRTVAAMGATLIGFGAVRAAITVGLRPRFRAPVTVSYPFTDAGASLDHTVVYAAEKVPVQVRGNWLLRSENFDRFGQIVGHGHGIQLDHVGGLCPGLTLGTGRQALDTCIQHFGVRTIATIQPIGRYWEFQGIETGIYLALAAVLVASTFWWLRDALT